jgi:hypothetical protein
MSVRGNLIHSAGPLANRQTPDKMGDLDVNSVRVVSTGDGAHCGRTRNSESGWVCRHVVR